MVSQAVISPSCWPVLADGCFLGYPLSSLHLGYIAYNGRPIGLTAIAKSEITLLTSMSAFEAIFSIHAPFSFLEHEH